MKASKLIAAVVSGAAALALVGGIAYAMEPDRDPATLPMPEAAQDTSIVKQVASIIVYEDQEEAVAMASEFDDIHDELAMDVVSSRASCPPSTAQATMPAPRPPRALPARRPKTPTIPSMWRPST